MRHSENVRIVSKTNENRWMEVKINMNIRKYVAADCSHLTKLFYDTVHSINVNDYNKQQLDAWAAEAVNFEEWNRSFLEHFTVVAVEGDWIVGFGDIDRTGYLDRLFVHKDYQGKGVGSSICDELEKQWEGIQVTTAASITAKPFFEKRGYKVACEQEVLRQGVKLKNYVMKKLRVIENTPIIETSRLVLRRFVKEDANALFLILKDKEVNTFLPLFPLKRIEEAQKYLQEHYLDLYKQPTGYHYAICLKSDNIPIGYVNVSDDDSCDFGYGLRKEFWHKGIVTEACEAVVARLRNAGFLYLTATHDLNNPRSGEVMKKIGMTYRYSYEEQWQPKDILVTFRMYQFNFDGQVERLYRKYWDKYPNHFVEEEIDCQEHSLAAPWMERL